MGVIIIFRQTSVASKPEKNLAGRTECPMYIMLSGLVAEGFLGKTAYSIIQKLNLHIRSMYSSVI